MVLNTRVWGSGDRKALLLHGVGSSSKTWQAVGPALAARGYRVVAVDLPGHGLSQPEPDATVGSFVAALLESVDPRPALAIGHSMGGLVLAAAAERLRPERAVYVDIRLGPGPDRPMDRATLFAEFAADQAGSSVEALRAARPWWSEAEIAIEAEAAAQWDVATAAALWESVWTHDFTPRRGEGVTATAREDVMVHADPSDSISSEQLAGLAACGFAVRGVPGAGHTIWYGRLQEFLEACLSSA